MGFDSRSFDEGIDEEGAEVSMGDVWASFRLVDRRSSQGVTSMSSTTSARKLRNRVGKDPGGERKEGSKGEDRKVEVEGKEEVAVVANQGQGRPKRNRNRRGGNKTNREFDEGKGSKGLEMVEQDRKDTKTDEEDVQVQQRDASRSEDKPSVDPEDPEEEFERIRAHVETLKKELEKAQKKEKDIMEKKAKKEKERKLNKLSAEARTRASELLKDTAECNKSLDDATRVMFITLRQSFSDLRSLLTRREEELLSLLDWELKEQREGIVTVAKKWCEMAKAPEDQLLFQEEADGEEALQEMVQGMSQVETVTRTLKALAEDKRQAPRLGKETTEGFSNVVYSIFSFGGLREGHLLPPPIPGRYSLDLNLAKAVISQENPENCPEASPRSTTHFHEQIAKETTSRDKQQTMQQQQARKNNSKKPSSEQKKTAPRAHARGNLPQRATGTDSPSGRSNNTFGSYFPKQFTSNSEQVEAPQGSKKNDLTSYSRVAQRALDHSLRSAVAAE